MALINLPDNKIVLDKQSLSELILTLAEDSVVEAIVLEIRKHIIVVDSELSEFCDDIKEDFDVRKSLTNALLYIRASEGEIVFSEYQEKYKKLEQDFSNKIVSVEDHTKVVLQKVIVRNIKKELRKKGNALIKTI